MGFFNMKIVRTTIIDTDSRKSAASSIGRGIVGNFFRLGRNDWWCYEWQE